MLLFLLSQNIQFAIQKFHVWMRCEAQLRSEARRTDLYAERAPEAATMQIAKREIPAICRLSLSNQPLSDRPPQFHPDLNVYPK